MVNYRFGAIKWECSGTLDDGTGQAVLYAERDVAMAVIRAEIATR